MKRFLSRTTLIGILCVLAFLTLGISQSFAQDATPSPTPTPDSAEVTRLKELQAQAELRRKIAEARKAELEARFPKATASPLQGKTTVAEKLVEEQVAGYITVGEAANQIGASIYRAYPNVSMIAIYNDDDIQLLLIYSAATRRIGIYKTRYDKAIADQQTAIRANAMWDVPSVPCDEKVVAGLRGLGGAGFNPLPVAASVLGSFADVLAFFRTDVDIKGSTFTVNEPVVVTEVFRALREHYQGKVALYYPAEFAPVIDTDNSAILDAMESLFDAKGKADQLSRTIQQMIEDKKTQKSVLSQCIAFARQTKAQRKSLDDLTVQLKDEKDAEKIKQLKTQIAALQKKLQDATGQMDPTMDFFNRILQQDTEDAARLDREITALQEAQKPVNTLNAETEILFKDIIKVDEKTGLTQIAKFIRAERIKRLLEDNNGCWLKLEAVLAGGNTKIKTNLIVDVFTGGQRVSYAGASIIEYHLYDRYGRSLLSDTITSYLDYRKANALRRYIESVRSDVDQPDPARPKVVQSKPTQSRSGQ